MLHSIPASLDCAHGSSKDLGDLGQGQVAATGDLHLRSSPLVTVSPTALSLQVRLTPNLNHVVSGVLASLLNRRDRPLQNARSLNRCQVLTVRDLNFAFGPSLAVVYTMG
jgi:hypothetical protein